MMMEEILEIQTEEKIEDSIPNRQLDKCPQIPVLVNKAIRMKVCTIAIALDMEEIQID